MPFTISTNAESKSQNTMKFTLITITAFAALISTGYAENLRNADTNLDAAPNAAIMDETQGGMTEPLIDENAGKKRTLRIKEDDATEEHAPQMTTTTKAETGGTRALGTKGTSGGNKKDYSGQSCSLCCDDDYHC
jgi:hypothetical protein